MKNFQFLSSIANPVMTSNVQVTMKWKNEKDEMGFWKGLMVVAWIYALAFVFYNWAYARGQDSEKCRMKHNYSFERVKPAFLAVKR